MKRLTKKQLLCILIPALLLLAAVWTFLPRSFEAALPGFDREAEVTHCYAFLLPTAEGNPGGIPSIEVPTDSAAYEHLMKLLRSTTYLRSPGDLLRLGQASDSHYIALKPHYVHLYLRQGEQIFSATFYGNHMVMGRANGPDRTYFPLKGKDFQQMVASLIATIQTKNPYEM